jgi:tRNA 2-thiouridine synthesizing protein A
MKQDQPQIVIDARGLNCPLPVLRLRKCLKDLEVGAVVELLATDRAALHDVPAFCEAQGHRMTIVEQGAHALRFVLQKG